MKPKIAIIYTTFLRNELAKKTIDSILNNWRDDFVLLVGDQRHSTDWILWNELKKKKLAFYFKLPFDCGVSRARNVLIQEAVNLGLDYSIVTADSIEFTSMTVGKLDMAIKFLDSYPEAGIIGFDLKDRTPWEYGMDLHDGSFVLRKTGSAFLTFVDDIANPITGLLVKKCDICRQFFLAKTETLQRVQWDNDLKTADHEDFFWRYKQAGYGVYWTPNIIGNYIDCKPAEYVQYRNRMYNEFKKILQKKYNLSGWVVYR